MVSMTDAMSEFIIRSRYSRYRKDDQRRENWEESCDRVQDMHLRRYHAYMTPALRQKINNAMLLVREKVVLPSMRSMQMGGAPVEDKNERIFNCSVRHMDSPIAIREAFFVLLCGCGIGLGVGRKYVNRFPPMLGHAPRIPHVHVIEDTIEGWANAAMVLVESYLDRTKHSNLAIEFDYSAIRPKGSPLKTTGGKAPGPEPLRAALDNIKRLLDRCVADAQSRLRPIDVFDIVMHCSDAVLAGGVRRSSCNAIFDFNDLEMMWAKTGNWSEENPQRARANISARILRRHATFEQVWTVVQACQQWGDPGFFFANNEDELSNPCFEIGFEPVVNGVPGTQFCNLTTIVGGKISSSSDFIAACDASALIGTLQAGYTDFKTLTPEAKRLTETEALLGCSITGIMDNRLLHNPALLRNGAEVVSHVNVSTAHRIGINPAARLTCVKPEGTSTLAVGGFGSGCNPGHAQRFIRRVQMNRLNPVYEFFKKHNPHMVEASIWDPNGETDVINFPMEAPEGAITKGDIDALQHLSMIRDIQMAWVKPGSSTMYNRKEVHHSVSCTVVVDDGDWHRVAEYLYKHRYDFTAVALLARSGDKDFKQAPNEAMVTPEEFEYFQSLKDRYVHPDYDSMVETEDGTELQREVACAGGKCEL